MEFTAEHILISGTPIGDIQIRYYGIIVVTAMLVAASFAARLADRTERDPDHIWGALTWGIFPGIIGARLWYITFPPISLVEAGQDTAYFFSNFFNLTNGAIAVWSGGLHIFGAVLGGGLGVYLYFSRFHNLVARIFHYIFLPITSVFELIFWGIGSLVNLARGEEVQGYRIPPFETEFPDEGKNILPWLDFAGITLPLAQAIGRWANYVNQELYGTPTNLPWGISIDSANRVGEYTNHVEYPIAGELETMFHPLFLYESIWNIGAFFVLLYLYNNNRDKFRQGDFFLLYLAQYMFVRFFLEFIRVEQALVGGINTSQVGAAIVFVIAVALFFMRRGGATGSYENAEPEPAEA